MRRDEKVAALGGWTRGGSAAPGPTSWRRTDDDGSRWESTCAVEPDGEGTFHVRLSVRRMSPDLAL